ncbi:MAG: ribonuclease HII [Oscillospiraceae bacterium]|nr:ribonuclease HII [Oscillospiraceae bacterium]
MKENVKEKDLWVIENSLYENGYKLICGVDEAGRGPLAGPVCAAAVVLPRNLQIEGLDDSKKLSEKKREALFPRIQDQALDWSVAYADVEEIESLNILQATFLAMNRAIAGLNQLPSLSLIDGNRREGIESESLCIVGGDGRCASIAAASILAKISRDHLMLQYAEVYPEYGFERHKGYGTKAHYEALRRYGPCPVHRPSFLRSYYEKR